MHERRQFLLSNHLHYLGLPGLIKTRSLVPHNKTKYLLIKDEVYLIKLITFPETHPTTHHILIDDYVFIHDTLIESIMHHIGVAKDIKERFFFSGHYARHFLSTC